MRCYGATVANCEGPNNLGANFLFDRTVLVPRFSRIEPADLRPPSLGLLCVFACALVSSCRLCARTAHNVHFGRAVHSVSAFKPSAIQDCQRHQCINVCQEALIWT